MDDRLLFDQRSRYRACADVLKAIASPGATVLDCGSGPWCPLESYLDGFELTHVDPLLKTRPNRTSSMLATDVFDAALDGRSWDFVVSVDMLEHVPPERREELVRRLCAFARRGVILAAPCSDAGDAIETDRCVNDAYAAVFGQPYPFLDEHRRYGLPSLKTIRSQLEASGWHVQVRQNGHTPWLRPLLSHAIKVANLPEAAAALRELSDEFDRELYPFDHLPPAYRQIVIATRDRCSVPEPDSSSGDPQLAAKQFVRIESRLRAVSAAHLSRARWRHRLLDPIQRAYARLPLPDSIKLRLRDLFFFVANPLLRGTPELAHYEEERDWRKRQREFAQRSEGRTESVSQAVTPGSEPGGEAVGTDDPSVSLIVVTYGHLELTKLCLESVEQCTNYRRREVIVVDNASGDGTTDFLRTWSAEDPSRRRVILNDSNRGFPAAVNQGLAAAQGDCLVVLNNDVVVTAGWLRTLVGHLNRDPRIGIIGPVTNAIANEACVPVSYDNLEQMPGVAARYTREHLGEIFDIRTLAFFCVVIRRSVFEAVGGLDEEFGLGTFEDDDYCRRVEARGYRIVCAEDAFVHHRSSASIGALDPAVRRELFDRNRKRYESKWGRWEPHRRR